MLGVPTPDEALRRVSPKQFAEFGAWQALKWKRTEKQDLYLAQIVAMLSGREDATIKDYLFDFEAEEATPLKLTGQEMAQMFKAAWGTKES